MDENDIRDWYYTGRMPIAFDMEEFNEMVNRIKAEAWGEGLKLAVGNHPPHTMQHLFELNPYEN